MIKKLSLPPRIYILFISLSSLCSGILNTFGRFAVPALAPALLNLSLIGAAIWLAPYMEEPITALAWGVFIAGVAQLSMQMIALQRLRLLPRPSLNMQHPSVKRIMRLMLPAVLATSVVQVNLLVDTLIASLLMEGSISWLYLSDRFVELPVGLVAVALSTVLLPRLSRHYGLGQGDHFNRALTWGGSVVVIFAVPCLIGLFLLGDIILLALLQYREFSVFDTQMATASLYAYTVGLPAFMLAKILIAGLFARQKTKTLVKIAVIAMLINIVSNIALVAVWRFVGWEAEHAALALATSISGWLQCVLLYRAIRGEGYRLPFQLGAIAWQCIGAGVGMALMVWIVSPEFGVWELWSVAHRIFGLGLIVLLSASSYVALLYVFGLRWQTLRALEK